MIIDDAIKAQIAAKIAVLVERWLDEIQQEYPENRELRGYLQEINFYELFLKNLPQIGYPSRMNTADMLASFTKQKRSETYARLFPLKEKT